MTATATAPSPRTVAEALEAAARAFGKAGVEAPRRNAEALLAAALGWDRAKLLAHPEQELTVDEERTFGNFCRRRSAREPLEYILGRADFAGLVLACDRRVLIPRPETEDLVELAVLRLKEIPSPRIADLGTGSGALALALAARLPGARIMGTDASADAVAVSRLNAQKLKLAADFRLGRDLAPLGGESFDAIVANPPYIAEKEHPSLMPEVRDWEPRLALVAGPEGTEVLARWIAEAPARLKPGGWLAVEMGFGQADRVAKFFQSSRFEDITTTPDFAGIPRFVSGVRHG